MMVIAVNCTRPSGTCFCDSMDTGPQAREGFDLAMTELRGGFVVTVGSEQGAKLLQALPSRPRFGGGTGTGRPENGPRPRAHGPASGHRRAERPAGPLDRPRAMG